MASVSTYSDGVAVRAARETGVMTGRGVIAMGEAALGRASDSTCGVMADERAAGLTDQIIDDRPIPPKSMVVVSGFWCTALGADRLSTCGVASGIFSPSTRQICDVRPTDPISNMSLCR